MCLDLSSAFLIRVEDNGFFFVFILFILFFILFSDFGLRARD